MIGAVLTVICGLCLWWFQIGAPLSSLSYDLPFVFVQQAVTNDVIIVKMDDASRLELNETAGLWKRRTHARLLDKLRKDQSGMAIFDVLFADPGEEADNAELARAIEAHGNVVLAAEFETMSQPGFPGFKIQPPEPEFREAARTWGSTDLLPDCDMTVRSDCSGTEEIPSLPWRAAVLAGAGITNTFSQRMTERW